MGYTEQAKLVGDGTLFKSGQGFSTVLSDDGNTLAIGAYADVGQIYGGVWVFVRDGLGVWTQEQKLTHTVATGVLYDNHHISLAISGDGNTLAVGAPNSPDPTYPGHVSVWTRTAGLWTEEASSLVGEPVQSTNFSPIFQGASVALSQDGNTLAIGAPNSESPATEQKGVVFVFTRTDGVWTQQGGAVVGSATIGPQAHQGTSVALSDDGNTLVVGGPGDNLAQEGTVGVGVGAAWVFTRTDDTWTEQQKLVASSALGPAVNQGVDVAISGDGLTILVGGPGDLLGGDSGYARGAAFVWTLLDGDWTEGQKLSNPTLQELGNSVALSVDGSTAIVGTGNAGAATVGAAYVFARVGDVWTLSQILTPASVIMPTGVPGGEGGGFNESVYFGFASAFSRDTTTIAIGGHNDGKEDYTLGIGAVWIFTGTPGAGISGGDCLDCADPPEGEVGEPYEHQMAITGGTPPYTGSLSAGALPDGVTIDETVWISGTPTDAGSFTFTVEVEDSAAIVCSVECSINVNAGPAPGLIDCADPPEGEVGTAYSHQMGLSNGTAPYTVSLTAGALPDGLSIDNAALVSGTPTVAGTFTFTVEAQDSADPPIVSSVECSITIGPGLIACADPSDGEVGVSYSHQMTLSNGTAPYTVSVTAGALPDGLTIDGETALVSGTPTDAGTFTFTVEAQDSADPPLVSSAECSITINDGRLIECADPPDGETGAAYSHQMTLSGGTAPYTVSVIAGTLPDGLSIDNAALVSGTPTDAGTFTFTVEAVDSAGPAIVSSVECSITINNAAPRLIECADPPLGETDVPYSHQMALSGGTPPYTVSLTVGTLPDGLTIDNAALISGTPAHQGTSIFTVEVEDSSDPPIVSSVECSISIAAPPIVIECADPPEGEVGVLYSHQMTLSGGIPPYYIQIFGGFLPTGLSISSTGMIEGVPTEPGIFPFTVKVTDNALGNVNEVTCQIAIMGGPLGVDCGNPAAGAVGVPYRHKIQIQGGFGPYHVEIGGNV